MNSTKSQKKKLKSRKKKAPLQVAQKKSGYNATSGQDNTVVGSASLKTPVELMTSRDFQFDINAHVETLDQLMNDKVRIQKFKAAIIHNRHLFKGKCVLDVGCGIGILSLFAASAGAAKVYAVDSSNAIYYARKIVEDNGYEKIIEVLKGEIDEIDLPIKEVDIIISDWMGYSLLHESKCRSVIYARDKWLKNPGGLIFPDRGKLFIVAVEDEMLKNDSIEWWRNVYGFNMRCIRAEVLKEPRQEQLRPQQVISKEYPIKLIDLYVATIEDLGFRSEYKLHIQKTGRMDGIALYFHVYFTESHTRLHFRTDPWSACTNWMQTVFFFDQSEVVQDKDLYHGHIEFCPTNATGYDLNDIVVKFDIENGDPEELDTVGTHMSWRLRSSAMPPVETICTRNPDKNGNRFIDKINSPATNLHLMSIRDILGLPPNEQKYTGNPDKNEKFANANDKFISSVRNLKTKRTLDILGLSSGKLRGTENAHKNQNVCIDDVIPFVENLNLRTNKDNLKTSVKPSCAGNAVKNDNCCIDTIPTAEKKQALKNNDILTNRVPNNQKIYRDSNSIQIGDNMYSILHIRRGSKKQNKKNV